MSKQNDQVFQLSLTEIAFTLIFLLLLLLGYLLFSEQKKAAELQTRVNEFESHGDTRAAAASAVQLLKQALAAAGAAPTEEVVTKLVEAEKAKAENAQLKLRIEDMNQQLTALAEIQDKVKNATRGDENEALREQVVAALAIQKIVDQQALKDSGQSKQQSAVSKIRDAFAISESLRAEMKQKLQEEIPIGRERESVAHVVDRARKLELASAVGLSKESLAKENSDLRGQVQFLKNRLDARGGRDYPPCWADESGKVEFLFSVDLKPDSVTMAAAWPQRRDGDAQVLPGLSHALAQPHSFDEFKSAVKGIFDWSKAHDPQCRHYIQLRSLISDAVQSDRARLMVEDYFYKVEARR